MLIIANECVSPADYRGILAPELRTRLDAMARDYARILTRIDRMVDRDSADDKDRAAQRRNSAN